MQRIAIFSDIHGNGVALDAALADIRRHEPDRMVCLGDAVQGGSEPARVVEILQSLDCPVVMGNADSWILSGESKEQLPDAALEVREWTRGQLGENGLEFVAGFAPTVRIGVSGGRSLLCFHGSPHSFDDVFLPETPEEKLWTALKDEKANIFSGGHTHLQWTTSSNGLVFLNPGSVGVAYNRNHSKETFYIYPFAEYAIVHCSDDQIAVEFCQVPFDVDELEQVTVSSGKPYADRDANRYRPPQ